MFYEIKIRDHIRVPPKLLGENVEESVLSSLSNKYDGGFISKELGIVIGVAGVEEVKEGVIIAGDGAAYYDTIFRLLIFKPEIQEVVLGSVTDITDFGVFFNMGAIDGMIHISQTMDDHVTANKSGSLAGKDSKKILKTGDKCRARIIAISYKDINNPKIGLTMRQPWLGSFKWIEDLRKKDSKGKKEE